MKLKISIDNDIDFLILSAEAGAFGYSTEVRVKVVKKTGTNDAVAPALSTPDELDLISGQREHVQDDLDNVSEE